MPCYITCIVILLTALQANPYTYKKDREELERKEAVRRAAEEAAKEKAEPEPTEQVEKQESVPAEEIVLPLPNFDAFDRSKDISDAATAGAGGILVLLTLIAFWATVWLVATAPFWLLGAYMASYREAAWIGALLGLFYGPFGTLIACFADARKRCGNCRERINAEAVICGSCQRPITRTPSSKPSVTDA